MPSEMASESTVQPDFPAADTTALSAACLPQTAASVHYTNWLHSGYLTLLSAGKTTELAQSGEGNRAQKLTIPVRKPQKLAAWR